MICQNCKSEVVKEAIFCPNCGKNLKESEIQPVQPIQNDIQSVQQNQPVIVEELNRQSLVPEPSVMLQKQEVQESSTQNNVKPEQPKKKKKTLRNLIIIIILLTIFILPIVFGINYIKSLFNKITNNNEVTGLSSSNVYSLVKNENGQVKYIDGEFTDIKVKNNEDAYKALETLKDDLKFNDVKEEFDIISTDKSENITYYKFQQKYKDIEVYGNNLVISVDKDSKVLSFSGNYIPNIDITIEPKKTEDEVKEIVKKDVNEANLEFISSKKYVYADNTYKHLTYFIDVSTPSTILEYIVDANTGKIISKYETMETIDNPQELSLTGLDGLKKVTLNKTLLGKYQLYDPNRNIEIKDGSIYGRDASKIEDWENTINGKVDGNKFIYEVEYDGTIINDESTENISKMGVSALSILEDIYDYYYNVLGRKSFDDKGTRLEVHVGKKFKDNYEQIENEKTLYLNACWWSSIKSIVIGYMYDASNNLVPLIAKDVLAHEFTHAVIEYTANFAHAPQEENKNNPFETGSLNEGISDIMGSLIEGKNWTMGEDIITIRNLASPVDLTLDNEHKYRPSEKNGKYYYPYGLMKENQSLEDYLKEKGYDTVYDGDGGGKHHNSTVVGHAAYLMYEKGAFTSKEEMAKVWYNALFLMNSYSNFEDCALSVIKSAKNLGLSTKSIDIIRQAFYDTKMLEDPNLVTISGTVINNNQKLKTARVTIKDKETGKEITAVNTDENGKYTTEKIKPGTYELVFTKAGYETYKTYVTIGSIEEDATTGNIIFYGDAVVNVELGLLNNKNSNKKNIKDSKDVTNINCKSDNCHVITMYYLENMGVLNFEDKYSKSLVEDGTILGADSLTKSFSKALGDKIKLETDGETFTLKMGQIDFDFSLYYKGTDTKFNFNKPITEDIELEMKALDGLIDGDFIKDTFNNFFGN